MVGLLDPFVRGMAATRLLSGLLELSAALLMLRANRVDSALRINGLLGLAGPLILVATTAIGLAGVTASTSPWRLLLIGAGVALILLGTR